MANIKEEKQEQLNLVNELSRIISSYSDFRDLTEAIIHVLKKYVSIDWAALASISGGNITLSPLSSRIYIGAWENAVALENTPLALLVEKKHALLESDLRKSKFKDNEFYFRLNEQGIRSIIYMPLFSGREISGSFIIGSKREKAYHDRELKLCKYTTVQINTSLENYKSQEISKNDRETLEWFKTIFHYTKTPLTPIMSSSGLLAEEMYKQNDLNLLSSLAKNTDQAVHQLWRNLELFEKIAEMESVHNPPMNNTTAPKDILTASESYSYAIAESNPRSFVWDIADNLPDIRIDARRLEQVLRILLDNAVRRTEKEGNITVHAYQKNNTLVITISDSGPSISCADKLDLMKPFNPEYADQTRFPELFLSLAICRRIIEMNNGILWIEPDDRQGTTFGFSLPVIIKNGVSLNRK